MDIVKYLQDNFSNNFFEGGLNMGIPLTSYTVLKYLADGVVREKENRRDISMELALDALENYSVFAFVIHDPIEHEEFHKFFQKQFANLHYSSGQNLAFFGLVNSQASYNLRGQTPFYQDVRDMVEQYEDEQTEQGKDSYTAFVLANNLNIPQEMLPAIIITHDTRLKNFQWYRTSSDVIEDQFNKLTGISNSMKYHKENKDLSLEEKQVILFEGLKKQNLDQYYGMGTSSVYESLARELSDLMSFFIQTSEIYYDTTSEEVNRMMRKQRHFAINNTLQRLKELQGNIKEANIEDIENDEVYSLIEGTSVKLATYLAYLNKSQSNLEDELTKMKIKKEWLENHTYQLLQTALLIDKHLMRENHIDDLSPSAMCIAKMFEQEINHSFVHWIRKQNSIQLPKYFNKVQPNIEVKIRPNMPNGWEIDFNKKRNGKFQPPELGKSKTIAIHNIKPEDWKSIGIDDSSTFLREWSNILKVRNKAAHTEKVSYKELKDMKRSLSRMANLNIFEKLYCLKKEYKGSQRDIYHG